MLAKKAIGRIDVKKFLFHPKFRFFSSTIDSAEAKKFDNLSSQWWKDSSSFAVLRRFNKLRIPLIRDELIRNGNTDAKWINTSEPLHGLNILDVGCGGGIISEALARIGGTLVGIDASEESINEAKNHLTQHPEIMNRVKYSCSSIEELDQNYESYFDAVVASEVIEHVNDVELFVSSCCNILKPGGSLFVTTINKTWISNFLTIFAAEKILGIIPDGTHDWNKFIKPEDLQITLESNSMQVQLIQGICYNPLSKKFDWSDIKVNNYAMHAVKL